MPKQLLRIVGQESMIIQTLKRARPLTTEDRIWVVTVASQAVEVQTELASMGMEGMRILKEPVGRNTAAAIGLAAVHILRREPDAVMVVLPADHYIEHEGRFLEVLEAGALVARSGWLVTLGIPPTKPETGYGYIQRGEPLEPEACGSPPMEVFQAVRFTEKPDRGTAEAYLRSKEFFWNSGVFLWRADRFLEEMERHLPDHAKGLKEIQEVGEGNGERIRTFYEGLQPISVDYGIMEKAERVAVIPAEVGWSDVGSWDALWEILEKDSGGNVLQGDVLTLEGRGNLILSKERLVAALGLEDMVVVDTLDAVLICPRRRSQDVRALAERLRESGREEAVIHREVPKPWGAYRVLDRGSGYQVKWLDVLPGQRLSLQSHGRRAEHWIVVSGTATVTLDHRVVEVPCGEHIYIPKGSRHRVENRGEETLRLVEVQTGDYLGEDDIVRYEDDYGRT
jgi:mannose-1-phosphate guanylyltransferase/mannose-6-phosphate isomerase